MKTPFREEGLLELQLVIKHNKQNKNLNTSQPSLKKHFFICSLKVSYIFTVCFDHTIQHYLLPMPPRTSPHLSVSYFVLFVCVGVTNNHPTTLSAAHVHMWLSTELGMSYQWPKPQRRDPPSSSSSWLPVTPPLGAGPQSPSPPMLRFTLTWSSAGHRYC